MAATSRDKWSRRKRRSTNVLDHLLTRETNGVYQPWKYHFPSVRTAFSILPKRLQVPLTTLVDEVALFDRGHVFLGFSKDGVFVLSYTMLVDSEELSQMTHSPCHRYTLHWWRWAGLKPLIKVSQVPLFGDEEIHKELLLVLCFWPQDSSKVLIYGNVSDSPVEEEKMQCYLTVTAIPSLTPCAQCHKSRVAPPGGQCCRRHGFSVHTKYQVLSPYPSFCPLGYSMAKNGAVVLNTGDSVLAMAFHLHHDPGVREGSGVVADDWRDLGCAEERQKKAVRYSLRQYTSDTKAFNDCHGAYPLQVSFPSFLAEGQQSWVEVKEAILDVEQAMYWALTHHASWAARFISFVDYDLQVIQVCSETSQVLIACLAIVRAKPDPYNWETFQENNNDSDEPQMYQTCFQMEWSLRTGLFTVLAVKDLKEFNQIDLLGTGWSPLQVMSQRLRQEWQLPQPPAKAVYTLTNQAVIKGKSLKFLFNPLNCVALTL